MDIGSDSYRGKFPRIFAQGTRPMSETRDGGTDGRGPAGEFRPVSIVATGRFGGSRDMGAGRDKNPIRTPGRDRGR
jgi:hypothetical protein